MNRWMKVNQELINAPVHDSQVGLDLKLFVSPYDIPVAIKGEYDHSIQRFVIKLQYESPEERLAAPETAEHIEFYSGFDSGRLHKIVVDMDGLNADRVQVQVIVQQVERAIEQLRRRPPNTPTRRNYVAAQRAISQLPDLVAN